MNKALRVTAALLMLVLVVSLPLVATGCAADEEEPAATTESGTPADGGTADEAPAVDQAAGEAVVTGACTSCHDVTRVYLQSEMTDWNDVINKMETAHGAVLTDEQKADIAAFLASRQQSVGEQLLRGKCTTCHDTERIAAMESGTDWDAVVADMVDSHGAELTAQEQADIAAYLKSLQ